MSPCLLCSWHAMAPAFVRAARMDSPPGLFDLPDDLIQKVLSFLDLRDRCSVESVCRKLQALLVSAALWPDLEVVLSSTSCRWILRHIGFVRSLTLKSRLALSLSAASEFEALVCEVWREANQLRSLRLWSPPVTLAGLPRTLRSVKLDCWHYRNTDLIALSALPNLETLTIHFIGVGSL